MRRARLFDAVIVTAIAAIASVRLAAQGEPTAARLVNGAVSALPVQAVAGGEVVLSITVSETGVVGPIDVLRTTPPFTDAVVTAVRGWRFAPAEDEMRKPVASR